MKKAIPLIMCIALILLIGCEKQVTIKQRMEFWKTRKESELFLRWGAPDLTTNLNDGSKICTWKRIVDHNYNVVQMKRTFMIDPNGIVSGCSWEDVILKERY